MKRRIMLFFALFVAGLILAPAVLAQFPTLQYDISVVDVKTGNVTRVTFLDGSGEFNPSWSNNGKKIVHDVVTNTSHDLFVTEVSSGVSLPLDGGDGGNDASWSPNGHSIAFDRFPVGDNTVYVVPAGGGTRVAVVSDALDPEWAQNSQRVVFHRPSDGSIRAVKDDGSGEVLVVADGSQPSWSQNGQWVVFVRGGDIWKIRVNHTGAPAGSPIQVTSGPSNDGQPSWNNNSHTIVYHSDAGGDFDIWTVSANGGTPSKLTGMISVGEFDPAFSKNGKHVAFASFTPLPLVCDLSTPNEHDFNDVRLGVADDGRFGYDPPELNGHGFFPRFACDQYIFSAGILVGGIVNGQTRVAESIYISEFTPSEIGTSGAPFRVFNSTVAADVVNWPSEFSDGGGNPIILPNAQNLVLEYNDVNGTPRPGQTPLGVEIRQRSLAYDDPAKSQAIIVIWQIANKSTETIEDMHFGLFNDADIGAGTGFGDDRTSVVNGMGIAWDNDFSEPGFVAEPAIVGHFFLETPNGAPTRYSAILAGVPPLNDPIDEFRQYGFLSGTIGGESPLATDVRSFLATGPVDLAPGQSVLVAAAYAIGRVPTGTTTLATHPTTFRPDPNDPVLANLVQVRADVESFYDANLQGMVPLAPFARRQNDAQNILVPTEYALGQNYPNPFNPRTEITFSIPKEEFVTLKVYSTLGEEVASLVNGYVTQGTHRVSFDAQSLASGMYYYRLEAGAFIQTRKLILLK